MKAAVEERGEDVNQRDVDDVTPMSRAAEVGCVGLVIYLISKGGGVEAKDTWARSQCPDVPLGESKLGLTKSRTAGTCCGHATTPPRRATPMYCGSSRAARAP